MSTHAQPTDPVVPQTTGEPDPQLPRRWVAGAIGAAVVIGLAAWYARPPETDLTAVGWTFTLLSVVPLVAAQLALGHPQVWLWLRAGTGGILRVEQRWMVLPIACYILGGLAVGRFDPYATAIFVTGVFITIGTLAQADRGYPRMVWTDTTFWVVLWVPFDFRWHYDLWYGPDFLAYGWWAIMLTVVVVYGYGVLRDLPGLGYRLVPRWMDVTVAALATVGLMAVLVPIGLTGGYLRLPPSATPSAATIIVESIAVLLTVAIPEELFFRGILQNGLAKHLRDARLALVVAALVFGLIHWNNAEAVVDRFAYTGLATIAGLFYGWAFWRSRGLLAPILCHTLVDLVWHFGLQ